MKLLYYTPTWEGFLTAVFEAFVRIRKREPVSVRHPREANAFSLFSAEHLPAVECKARRVERGMAKLARDLSESVYLAWLSETPGVEDTIVALLELGFAENRDPRGNLANPVVISFQKALRATGGERQRMLQFVRFVQTEEGIYVADIDPKCDVLSLIAGYFHGRFNNQRLLIRDVKRRLILVSQQEGWFIRQLTEEEALPPLPKDGLFEDLWRGYFYAIANPARINLKLQQKFVPLKYRQYLTEFM